MSNNAPDYTDNLYFHKTTIAELVDKFGGKVDGDTVEFEFKKGETVIKIGFDQKNDSVFVTSNKLVMTLPTKIDRLGELLQAYKDL